MYPDCNNLATATEMLKLRKVQAELHGYKSFVKYQCTNCMARMSQNVKDLLENNWAHERKSAGCENEALNEYVKELQDDLLGSMQPWDWHYYIVPKRCGSKSML
jgi:Zn-dependent oligopeptidase